MGRPLIVDTSQPGWVVGDGADVGKMIPPRALQSRGSNNLRARLPAPSASQRLLDCAEGDGKRALSPLNG